MDERRPVLCPYCGTSSLRHDRCETCHRSHEVQPRTDRATCLSCHKDQVRHEQRHLGFQAAWFSSVPLRLRPERVPRERRWRMIPLGIIGHDSPLDRALRDARAQPDLVAPIGLHPNHPNGLVLVPEATWEWVLTRLPPRSQQWWREWHTR